MQLIVVCVGQAPVGWTGSNVGREETRSDALVVVRAVATIFHHRMKTSRAVQDYSDEHSMPVTKDDISALRSYF